jgi:hypothetical protein
MLEPGMVLLKSSAVGTVVALPFSLWTVSLLHRQGITKDMMIHHPMEVHERLKAVETQRLVVASLQGLLSGFASGASARAFSANEDQAFQVLVARLVLFGTIETAAAVSSASSGVNPLWVPLDMLVGPLMTVGGCLLGHTFGPRLIEAVKKMF